MFSFDCFVCVPPKKGEVYLYVGALSPVNVVARGSTVVVVVVVLWVVVVVTWWR